MAVEAPQNKTNESENGRSSFYGREDVFAWIGQHLARTSPTQPLVLVGPPRIGKTAVLQQIMAGKLGRSIVPIFIDFNDLLQENLSIFLGDLAKLAANALAEAGIHIEPPDNTEFMVSPYKAFKNQFLIPALEKLGERKLLLVCDNLNLLFKAEENGRFAPQSFEAFYRLIHAHARAYTLFTLNNPDPALTAEPLALIDSLPHYEIKNLDQESAINLVQQSQDFVVFRDAAQFIYQITEGHPAYTQVYCQAVQLRKQSLNLRHITVADVTIVRQELAAANTLPPVNANSPPNFHIRQEQPRQRANYRLPGSTRNNSGLILALAGLGVLALIVVLAALLFRDPIEQRLAGGQPPTNSETAVFLTSEALAAALIAATPTATETAVPTQTAIVTPSASATQPPTATHTATPPATNTPTSTPTSTPAQPGDLVIREADGMPMRYVPGGVFTMGSSDEDLNAAPDEKPQHEVSLDPFYMDQHEVSVAQYAAFLNRLGGYKNACLEKDCVHPRFEAGFTSYLLEEDQGNGKFLYIPLTGFANYPINHVSWYGAQAYCQAMGGRLPTEAEWEFAARGSDGRIYPWGNQAPNENLAVFNSESYENLKPVDALPAGSSPFNILGMAGSMWEWTNDWYDEEYYSVSPDANPTGPETGLMKAIRGGAWPNNNLADRVRAANRSNFTPDFISATVGFRCAQDP